MQLIQSATSYDSDCVLVCVTDLSDYENLISSGRLLANSINVPLHVIAVFPEELVNTSLAESIQNLYDQSTKAKANLNIIFNDNAMITTAIHAKSLGNPHIVINMPGPNTSLIIKSFKELLPDSPLSIVESDQSLYTFPPTSSTVVTTTKQ